MNTSAQQHKIAIIGSGPAGLMAASVLANSKIHNLEIHVFERRPSLGRKLLIAGSSGLNISHHAPMEEFIKHYQGFTPDLWRRFFALFSPQDWISAIQSLGLETFLGTSSRYFVKEMKASGLLRAWVEDLKNKKVKFYPDFEWRLENNNLKKIKGTSYDAVGFFMGGGSWEEHPPQWPEQFNSMGIKVVPFYPTNVGYEVDWKPEFLKEAEGKPLKNIMLTSSLGKKEGDLVVTSYGLEGTPIYFYGLPGEVFIDLKPALSLEEILEKLNAVAENLSPIRRIKKELALGEASQALLYHHTTELERKDLLVMAQIIKRFPLTLVRPRPLKEAISSGGGVDLSEMSTTIHQELMLKKYPGVFCGGEMLNWTAPTGGFLIQASVTQGAVAGKNILHYLAR